MYTPSCSGSSGSAATIAAVEPRGVYGHTFALGAGGGARKDTAVVLPGQSLPIEFDADYAGRWMVHCRNVYHGEADMQTLLGYLR